MLSGGKWETFEMAVKTKAERIWALYKGDEFIALGTIAELAEQTGKRFDSLMWMTNDSYKKRPDKGNKTQLYEVEDDE